jgi:hypothetical protein
MATWKLTYETNPMSGTQELRLDGLAAAGTPSLAERKQLEQYLQAHYPRLCRQDGETIDVTGRKVQLRVLPGANYRQPTLELRPAETPATALPACVEGLLAAWRGLGADPAGMDDEPDPAKRERVALRTELDGLERAGRENPTAFATLLLAGVLTLGEQQHRREDVPTAGFYTLALRSLGRLAPAPDLAAASTLADRPPGDPAGAGGWLAHLLRWVFGGPRRDM